MTEDTYSVLIPMLAIPAAAVVLVCVFLYLKNRWEGYKARRRAEGRD